MAIPHITTNSTKSSSAKHHLHATFTVKKVGFRTPRGFGAVLVVLCGIATVIVGARCAQTTGVAPEVDNIRESGWGCVQVALAGIKYMWTTGINVIIINTHTHIHTRASNRSLVSI